MKALTELHISHNHAWVLCSPHLPLQWGATGPGCHAPTLVPLMGSYGLGGQSWQELSPPSQPAAELDVTPGAWMVEPGWALWVMAL